MLITEKQNALSKPLDESMRTENIAKTDILILVRRTGAYILKRYRKNKNVSETIFTYSIGYDIVYMNWI